MRRRGRAGSVLVEPTDERFDRRDLLHEPHVIAAVRFDDERRQCRALRNRLGEIADDRDGDAVGLERLQELRCKPGAQVEEERVEPRRGDRDDRRVPGECRLEELGRVVRRREGAAELIVDPGPGEGKGRGRAKRSRRRAERGRRPAKRRRRPA